MNDWSPQSWASFTLSNHFNPTIFKLFYCHEWLQCSRRNYPMNPLKRRESAKPTNQRALLLFTSMVRMKLMNQLIAWKHSNWCAAHTCTQRTDTAPAVPGWIYIYIYIHNFTCMYLNWYFCVRASQCANVFLFSVLSVFFLPLCYTTTTAFSVTLMWCCALCDLPVYERCYFFVSDIIRYGYGNTRWWGKERERRFYSSVQVTQLRSTNKTWH